MRAVVRQYSHPYGRPTTAVHPGPRNRGARYLNPDRPAVVIHRRGGDESELARSTASDQLRLNGQGERRPPRRSSAPALWALETAALGSFDSIALGCRASTFRVQVFGQAPCRWPTGRQGGLRVGYRGSQQASPLRQTRDMTPLSQPEQSPVPSVQARPVSGASAGAVRRRGGLDDHISG
jgi:hypothetical protein